MPKTKKPWNTVDKLVNEKVKIWMRETTPRTTIGDIAQLLDASEVTLSARLRGQRLPFTVSEFSRISNHFGKEPGHALLEILVEAAQLDGRAGEALVLGKVLSDQRAQSVMYDLTRDLLSKTLANGIE